MIAALLVSVLLPIGLEVDGGTVATVELGPLTLADSLAASRAAESGAPDGMDADTWRGLCRLARRIRSAGSLPRSTFTAAWLLTLHEADAQALIAGAAEVTAREVSFRGTVAAPSAGDGAGREADGVVEGGAPGPA